MQVHAARSYLCVFIVIGLNFISHSFVSNASRFFSLLVLNLQVSSQLHMRSKSVHNLIVSTVIQIQIYTLLWNAKTFLPFPKWKVANCQLKLLITFRMVYLNLQVCFITRLWKIFCNSAIVLISQSKISQKKKNSQPLSFPPKSFLRSSIRNF